MPLPSDLLTRPAPEATRLLALGHLEEATVAVGRMADERDEEALHDFRVALRRLRSTLRAYRDTFQDHGGVGRKLRRRLRDLASATNRARDTEVLLAWIGERLPRLASRDRRGARWLVERLEQRQRDERTRVLADVTRDFAALARRARKRLSAYRLELGTGESDAAPPYLFGAVVAASGAAAADQLAERLSAVTSLEDAAAAHRARVAAKRLRYLLEPFADGLKGGAAFIRRLKALQDLLGEAHDLHLLIDEIAEAAGVAAMERGKRVHELALAGESPGARRAAQRRGDERAGLLALARLARARQTALGNRLAALRLAGGAAELHARLAAMATAPPPSPAPASAPPATPGSPREAQGSRRRTGRRWRTPA